MSGWAWRDIPDPSIRPITRTGETEVRHHVDVLDKYGTGTFLVTCRRPEYQGGTMVTEWSQTTCRNCLAIHKNRREALVIFWITTAALLLLVFSIGVSVGRVM